jgi:hypothetical protein
MSKKRKFSQKVSEKEHQEHQFRLGIMKMIEDNPEIVDCPDFQKMLKEQGATLTVIHCDSREEVMEAITERIAEHPDGFLTKNAEQLFYDN